jgi:hypothetical protein
LARLPQLSIEHQRRERLRLWSRKSQVQVAPSHSRTRARSPEVSSSAAERAMGRSGAASGSPPSSAQSQA